MYKLYINALGQTSIKKIENGIVTSFTQDPANSDYQEFLRWCEAGNEPLPPDSQE
jgi:hypothetical protein